MLIEFDKVEVEYQTKQTVLYEIDQEEENAELSVVFLVVHDLALKAERDDVEDR